MAFKSVENKFIFILSIYLFVNLLISFIQNRILP